jgi:hypothetical protein
MPQLTPARRKALAVLGDARLRDVPVWTSNATTPVGAERPTVYWQAAQWLIGQGYVERDGQAPPYERLSLTPAGVDFAIRELS